MGERHPARRQPKPVPKFHPGDNVRLVNLTDTDLNNKTGVVFTRLSSGRLEVILTNNRHAAIKPENLEIDVEDTAHLVLGFAANSSERSLVASVNLDFIRQDTTRQCTAIGKLGSLRWNGITGTVELWSHDTEAWYEVFKHQTNGDESYAAEWKNMIACIKKGSLPFVSGLDGLEVLKIIDASRLSTKARQRVEIDRVNDVQEV